MHASGMIPLSINILMTSEHQLIFVSLPEIRLCYLYTFTYVTSPLFAGSLRDKKKKEEEGKTKKKKEMLQNSYTRTLLFSLPQWKRNKNTLFCILNIYI